MSSSVELGELEVQVLEWLWSNTSGTAKQIHHDLQKHRGISLNTIQSTVERLRRKALVSRTKQGHSFQYLAIVDKEQLLGNLITDLFGRFQSDVNASAAAILNATEHIDIHTLDALEQAIKLKRKALSAESSNDE